MQGLRFLHGSMMMIVALGLLRQFAKCCSWCWFCWFI